MNPGPRAGALETTTSSETWTHSRFCDRRADCRLDPQICITRPNRTPVCAPRSPVPSAATTTNRHRRFQLPAYKSFEATECPSPQGTMAIHAGCPSLQYTDGAAGTNARHRLLFRDRDVTLNKNVCGTGYSEVHGKLKRKKSSDETRASSTQPQTFPRAKRRPTIHFHHRLLAWRALSQPCFTAAPSHTVHKTQHARR